MRFWTELRFIVSNLAIRVRSAYSFEAWRLLRPTLGLWLELAPHWASSELVNNLRDLDAGQLVAWRSQDNRVFLERDGVLLRAYCLEYLLAILDSAAIKSLPYPATLPRVPPTRATRRRRRHQCRTAALQPGGQGRG